MAVSAISLLEFSLLLFSLIYGTGSIEDQKILFFNPLGDNAAQKRLVLLRIFSLSRDLLENGFSLPLGSEMNLLHKYIYFNI
jgi:hypothetical protein